MSRKKDLSRDPIYQRYAEQEAAGYLSQLIASRCHLAGLKFGIDADLDRIVGGIRHDTPVDAIASLITRLSLEKCLCEPDDDEPVDAAYCHCRVGTAKGIIKRLREGPRHG